MNMRVDAILVALSIAACATPLRAADDTPKARLAAIETAQKGARERYSKELEQVERTETAQAPARDRFLKEVDKNVDAALELARAHPDDATAFEALKFVIRTNGSGPGDGSAQALRLILSRGDDRRKGQSDYLAHVALRLFQYADAETLLRRVLEQNPNRNDRAASCYWLAHHLSHQAHMVRRLRKKPDDMKYFEGYAAAVPIARFVKEKDPEALDKMSEALLQRVASEFGDVRMPDTKRTLAEIVAGELFKAQSLNVGKPAPEIDGTDHEGKSFKLSETRGKVVVLTFSGNWCGPCVGMYPQERALLAKHKGRPFAMVSVNTDDDVATLKKAIAAGEITWRCWWESGTEGPITTRWGIDSFPSIFVLDRLGVIRFKDLRDDDLDRAVSALLDAPDEPPASD